MTCPVMPAPSGDASERGHGSELLGLEHPVLEVLGLGAGPHLFGRAVLDSGHGVPVGEGGVRPTRADAVHGDAVAAGGRRQRFGQADQAVFGGCVAERAGGPLGCTGSDVDHPAVLLLAHVRQRLPRGPEGGDQVEDQSVLEAAVIAGEGVVVLADGSADVVDEHVHSPELGDRHPNRLPGLVAVRGIGHDGPAPGAEAGGLSDHAVEVGLCPRGHDDRRPVPGQRQRDGSTDSVATTSDHRDPLIQPAHVPPLRSFPDGSSAYLPTCGGSTRRWARVTAWRSP